jgi:hypothetical protein
MSGRGVPCLTSSKSAWVARRDRRLSVGLAPWRGLRTQWTQDQWPSILATHTSRPVAKLRYWVGGQYQPDPAGSHVPLRILVLGGLGGEITGLHSFLDAAGVFPRLWAARGPRRPETAS